ncbi:chaperone protein DnaJ [Yersinia aldovae]|uniref:J domain-containing protein n=1 Tax=Yersinia aldovae TaxID=29483 RepID=UPI0005DABF5D|nr:J domain-containing protein [Yersinia aldovae]CNK26005.1 chaperone protein DnaJ [Yersinia aldovae]
MNLSEALNVFGLSGDITVELIKITYRKLAKQYHPDRNPAGAHMMKMVNAAFDFIKANINEISGYHHEQENAYNYSKEVNEVLNKITELEGLIIEIIGNWIWISGNTIEHRLILKELNCMYAGKKKMWYYRPEEYKSSNRKNLSIDEIRDLHGTSGTRKTKDRKALQAA